MKEYKSCGSRVHAHWVAAVLEWLHGTTNTVYRNPQTPDTAIKNKTGLYIHISNLTDIILTMSFMGSFCTTSFRVCTIVQVLRPRLPSITEFQYIVKEITLLLLKVLSNLGQNTEICHNFAINFTQKYWNLCKNERKCRNSNNLFVK